MNSLGFLLCFLMLQAPTNEDDSSRSAEIQQVQTMIRDLTVSGKQLKRDQSQLRQQLKVQERRLDSLARSTVENRQGLGKVTDTLTTRLEKTERENDARFSDLGGEVNQSRLQWLLGLLAVCALSLVGFVFVRKRLLSSKNELEQTIAATRKSLEEESVKLDSKLAELLASQLKLQTQSTQDSDPSGMQIDHTLALRVADEVVRMQRNIAQMDPGTRGLKQLGGSVTRLQDNLQSMGYEVPNMLNRKYDDGMKVIANFVPDPSSTLGDQTITRIIKPQVNYKGVMIQSAQVEVSVPVR